MNTQKSSATPSSPLDYHVTDPDGEVRTKAASRWFISTAVTTISSRRSRKHCRARRSASRSRSSCNRTRPLANTIPEMVQIEPRKDFPKELQVGMQFEGGPEDGGEDDFVIYRVTDIADDKVILDGNHPLAGMALVFTCTVTAIRPASAGGGRTRPCASPDDDEETCH